MNERKIHYIDVSKMSEKDICDLLKIKYVPWYRDSLFWALVLVFATPSVALLIGVLQ